MMNFCCRIDSRTLKKSLPHKKRISRKLKKSCSSARKMNKCNLCEQTFSTMEEYTRHQALCQTTITPINPTTFSCQICTCTFTEQLEFFGHLKSHYEPPSREQDEPAPVSTVHFLSYSMTMIDLWKNAFLCFRLQNCQINRNNKRIKRTICCLPYSTAYTAWNATRLFGDIKPTKLMYAKYIAIRWN